MKKQNNSGAVSNVVGFIRKDVSTVSKFFVILLAFVSLIAFSNHAYAATGDISAVRILGDAMHNGWTAEIDIEGVATGGTYNMGLSATGDLTNPKVVFTVNSPGYDASGNATTITRTVYGTKYVRQPYPNQALAAESSASGITTIKVSLSEFIYAGDTSITANIASGLYTKSAISNNSVTGFAVTNNSVLAYPKVIGRWAWPGYEKVTGDFLVEALAFNKFAKDGKPVAAVKFTATDQHGNSVTQTVSDMTKTTRTGDANVVQVYAATMPVSTLTQGDLLEVNFQAFPWVGDASSTINSAIGADGVAQPDERLGPLSAVNDKNGTYGSAFAVVDDVNGLDTNAITYVQNTQSGAESDYASNPAHSYKNIGRATAAIKAYNSATYARNEQGGGVILLNAGNHAYPGTAPTGSSVAMNTWLIIKPMSTVSKTDALINSGTFTRLNTQKVKLEGVNLAKNTAGAFFATQATDLLWVDNSIINTGTSSTALYVWNQIYATRNTVNSLVQGFRSAGVTTNKGPFALVRGNSFSGGTIGADVYTVIGNNNVVPNRFLEAGNSQGQQISDNAIVAFNSVFNLPSGPDYNQGATNIASGTAIIQNVFEAETSTSPIMNLAANTNQVNTTNNILLWNNTLAGARQNLAYNAYGSTPYTHTNWSMVGNQWDDFNVKSDNNNSFDAPNGGRTGDWAVLYGVGSRDSFYRIANFPQEFYGLSSVHSGTPGYIADNSARGSVTGNGNYNLLATSGAIDLGVDLPNLGHVLPFDFLGNPIYGIHDAGAYEYQPPYTMGVDGVSTSATVRMYGNEKFRNKTTATSSATANIAIEIPANNTNDSLDIAVSAWDNANLRHKNWIETSVTSGLTNTVHTIGDLNPSKYYDVSVDSTIGNNIIGENCTAGVCLSDENGKIAFTYTGTYSTHTFDVIEEETHVAPPISISGVGSSAEKTVTVTWTTDKESNSIVNYGTDTSYGTTASSTDLVTSHSLTISGLNPTTTYHYQIISTDIDNNTATSSDKTF